MSERRNDIRLWTEIDGEHVSHFRLWEFESRSTGLVCVSPNLLQSLERLRLNLSLDEREEVEIIITCGTRLDAENKALAARLGWIDEGGQVSRDSRHLPKHGGIAADFWARFRVRPFRLYNGIRGRLAPEEVHNAAKQVFDWTRVYKDGHVHGDNRDGGKKLKTWERENGRRG